MNLLVCGGRGYDDRLAFDRAMANLPFTPDIVIEGGAPGTDRMAHNWAVERGIHTARVLALWSFYGPKKAGGLRNSAMLLLKVDYCLALPGGTGTADMVDKCQEAGIPVYAPYE